jgi:hypothetical protein
MPEYTTCVQPADYRDPPLPKAGTAAAPAEALFATLALLEDTCDYMLHGKLVCLGGDKCAIGHVAGFETVADKSFPDTIDNDFSINLLFSPWDLEFFTYHSREEGYKLVANDTAPGTQGVLIKEQPGMPLPRESETGSWHSDRYAGTFNTFPDRTYITYNPPLGSRGAPYDVPVFHCEIEGERARLVCETLDRLSHPLPGMKSFCKRNWFTRLVCRIAQWLLTPRIAPALAAAWVAGSDDNRDYQGGGSLSRGDLVAIHGRWVYDAGHQGQNELHPVKTIQKVPEHSARDEAAISAWCKRIGEVPPAGSDAHTQGLTPDQQTVRDAQLRPENRWIFHPAIDGCQPSDTPPPPPPPIIR